MTVKKSQDSKEIILHIAELAKLKPKKEDVDVLNKQVESTIEYISKLSEIDTSGVQPTSQVTGLTNVFREDYIDKNRMFTQKEALSGAKRTHNGFFVVDAILEQ